MTCSAKSLLLSNFNSRFVFLAFIFSLLYQKVTDWLCFSTLHHASFHSLSLAGTHRHSCCRFTKGTETHRAIKRYHHHHSLHHHLVERTRLQLCPRNRPQRTNNLHRLLLQQRRRRRTPIHLHLQPHQRISSLHAPDYEYRIPNGAGRVWGSGNGAVRGLDFGGARGCAVEG